MGTGKKYKISILGCGWYGSELASVLINSGHEVKGATTSESKIPLLTKQNIDAYLVSFKDDATSFDPVFFDSDILVITLPPNSTAKEQHDFKYKIRQIADTASTGHIRHLIFISSTAVYGDQGQNIDEFSITQPVSASGKSILAAEELLKTYTAFTTTIIRFGGLVGPGRDPGRFFAGKKDIPNGQAPVNLIHLKDCTGITSKIIQQQAFGYIFNACSPHHPKKQDFYVQAAINSGLPAPVFIDELKNWKIVSSLRVPKFLDYTYEISNWHTWFGVRK